MKTPPTLRRWPTLPEVILLSLLLVPLLAGCDLLGRGSGGGIPNFSHVFVILMENKEYDEVIGSSQAPYINELARTYSSASRYYAISHPSLPNYLALASGSTQGITDDCPDCSFDVKNLADQLDEKRKSWRSYAEDMPSPCYNGGFGPPSGAQGRPLYVRKHNPWMYFKSVSGNPQRCNQVVPLTQFSADLQSNRLPDYSWIAPNMMHDMHDGSIKDGDTWLASFVPRILDSPAWKDNGAIFLVWDEGSGDGGCCGYAKGGRTPAIVVSPLGRRGYQSNVSYTHYSLLRTIEEAWGTGLLGGAGDSQTRSMTDLFQ